MPYDVIVVGAGASGLAAAGALRAAGLDAVCLEARDRVGGRLLSAPGSSLDLGATWFWDGEERVRDLVARAGIEVFEQHLAGDTLLQETAGVRRLPGNLVDGPSWRFASGARSVADALAVGADVRLGTPVTAVHADGRGGLAVRTPAGTLHAGHVVLAVPPVPALERVDFGGALPAGLVRLARATPVWMGAVVKVVVRYPTAFWRADGLAGAAFSRTGPLQEVHDVSGPGGSPAALFGFAQARAVRPGFPAAVTGQLVRLFGTEAARPDAVHVQDWSAERWTSPAGVHGLADHSLFGDPRYRRPALDGRLHWASTETAADHAGHIEGALSAGERAARAVLSVSSGIAR
ncbi:flavin monoamine oxidase family protein [Streptomyces acidiscabies]|uniref:FAD-dependent oxidoreductase n=1 Tax=Streptomyces acidiscabies TaxID=42234 RepID=A0A0L0JR11_9ACTN|nr:FAD-dependent oxidoreductase [Streptomyces acidiscabies]KND27929.1 FAD-dependent oxidoreductase [Streptomyces acidiscabies]